MFIPLKLTNPMEIQVFGCKKTRVLSWLIYSNQNWDFLGHKKHHWWSARCSFWSFIFEASTKNYHDIKGPLKNLSFQTKVLSAPICRGCIPFGLARGSTGWLDTVLPLHLMLANTGLALRLATLLSTLLWKVTCLHKYAPSEKWRFGASERRKSKIA